MATVTPGITWASGNVLNVANMNAAANPTVALADGEVTTAKINDGAVTNAKIASGVDASKLTTGTLPIARIADGAVTLAKLANVTAGSVVMGNASNAPTATALSGDVTITSAGVTSLANATVKAAKLDGAQTGSAPVFGVRAWVNFDGTTSPPTVRASGNVASVTKNGTGDYTITFTTAMPTANYAVSGITVGSSINNTTRHVVIKGDASTGASSKTTTSVTVATGASSGTGLSDVVEINLMFIC